MDDILSLETLMGYDSPDDFMDDIREKIINKINDISSEKLSRDAEDDTDETDC